MQNVKKKNISSGHINYYMSTMLPRWVQDRRKELLLYCHGFVASRSCDSRVNILRQSCDNRTTIVSCLGLFFRFSCQWMFVLLSCHCRVTVVLLWCDYQQKLLKHASLHPHESNEITGRFPLQLIHQCTILPKHQAPFNPPTSGVSLVLVLFTGSNQR